MRDLLENANPTAAIYCKTGECEIRITARAASDAEGEKMCREYAKKFYDLLGTPGIRTAQRPSCSNHAPGAVPWWLMILCPFTGTMACLRLLGVVTRPERAK